MKYRVKVETTKDGSLKYTPQVGRPKLSIGKFDHLWLDWENIIVESNNIWSTKNMRMIYDNQEEALHMIKKYKVHMVKVQNSEVKSVNYINLD